MQPLALGVDLGTSGVRVAVIDPDATLLHCSALLYPSGLRHADDWRACTKQLIRAVPAELRDKIHAMAVDGTSGTLLACRTTGHPLGPALTYSESCIEQAERLQTLASDGGPATSSSGSLARALRLLDQHHDPDGGLVLLRHQADWLTGWLLQDWSFERRATISASDGNWRRVDGPRDSSDSHGRPPCLRSGPVAICSDTSTPTWRHP